MGSEQAISKKNVSVSEVADIYLGGTPKTFVKEYWNGNISWASAKDVSSCKSRYIFSTEKTITKKGIVNSAAKILPKNTIVITSRGTVGKVCLLPFPMSFNQTCYGLVARRGTDPVYLFYKIKSITAKIDALSYGTVFSTITLKTFDDIRLDLPSQQEQQVIADILGTLDDKIELNRQVNKTLEKIGQAIFKRWFVDFEFPNEGGKPYKSSGGEMVNAELGRIPKGWLVKPFSEVIRVNPRRILKKGTFAVKVGMADLNPWQSWVESWENTEYKSGPKFQNGDIIFARITPSLENGKTALVSFLDNNEIAFGTTEFIVLAPKMITSSYYVFYLARSQIVRDIAIGAMTGSSGRQRVPNDCFDYPMIPVPPKYLVEQFHNIISSTFDLISKNAKENMNLVPIRDALLPKLMSGEIRVEMKQ